MPRRSFCARQSVLHKALGYLTTLTRFRSYWFYAVDHAHHGNSRTRSYGLVAQTRRAGLHPLSALSMWEAHPPMSEPDRVSVTCCRRSATGGLIVSLIILLLTLGVVGIGTWGLTDSIKNTNHQVDAAWDLADDASNTVRSLLK